MVVSGMVARGITAFRPPMSRSGVENLKIIEVATKRRVLAFARKIGK